MKIGILTFHRAHNYGAVLQCYALQMFLSGQGHQVRVIDYDNKDLWKGYNWYKPEEVRYAFSDGRRILKRIVKLLLKWRRRIPRYYRFSRFQSHRLELCPVSEITRNPFDLVLIGSDQVWNTRITNGFDPYYWGQFEKPVQTRTATFAASLIGLWDESDWLRVREYLHALDAISVREPSVARFLMEKDPTLNPVVLPDPVFLLSRNEWATMAQKPGISDPYIFFYQARGMESVEEIARQIAQDRGMKLIVLSAAIDGPNSSVSRNASPAAFVGWIMHADMVLTSSFHAMVFSIIFQKDFYCIDMNMSGDGRLKDVLCRFQLADRLIRTVNDYRAVSPGPYNPEPELSRMKDSAIRYVSSFEQQ